MLIFAKQNHNALDTIRLLFVALLLVGTSQLSKAQRTDQIQVPIVTAVPFLTHSPDARSASLGFTGVATSPDAFSMYYNPAKYAFLENEHTMLASGFNTYTGSLSQNRIMLHGIFAQKFAHSALAATMRYTFGDKIYVATPDSPVPFAFRPMDWAFDVAYSHCFSEYLSAGIAGRYIHSNVASLSGSDKKTSSIAADVSVYYKHPLGNLVDLSLGATVANIGGKMDYAAEWDCVRSFIPTTLRTGAGFKFNFHPKNTLTINLEFSKLLVPTPPIRFAHGSILYGFDDNVSVFRGMFQSFYDASGYAFDYSTNDYEYVGVFYQELHEISTGLGLEYSLADCFFARSGMHFSAKSAGSDICLTEGVGLHFGIFGMDVSYYYCLRNSDYYNMGQSWQGILRWDMYFAF